MQMAKFPEGIRYLSGYFPEPAQRRILAEIRDIVSRAPLYVPTMPKTGKPFSVRMTNCGPLGWVSSKDGGYRYQRTHPETDRAWPPMPECLKALWKEVAGYPAEPEACLINWYAPRAKLGLHVDADEEDARAPVISVSLGDDAWFRIGGLRRTDPTQRVLLKSGDVIVLGGPARLIYHGVERIVAGTSPLIDEAGRFNLTMRRVHIPTS
jgi:DNA oxidative demethylase